MMESSVALMQMSRTVLAVNELKKNKILVRHFNKNKIKNWLRVSIGTKRECEKLLKILKKIVLRD